MIINRIVSAPSGLMAQIIVNAPTGSTVTLDGTAGIEVSGVWTFTNVSLGTHTVTATKDSQTKSETVVVDEVAQYSVTIAYTHTVFLLHGDSYTDVSSYGLTLTNSGATIDSDGKFDKCITFGGSARLYAANQEQFRFGTDDFTVEFFMKATTAWTSQPSSCGIIGQKYSDSYNGWVFYRDGGYSSYINARLGAENNFPSYSTPTTSTWEHWAFVRSNGTVYWFKDGTLTRSGTNTANLNDTLGTFYIGYSQTWGGYLKAKLCEIRISAEALYTANFTPPTEPFSS